MANELIKATARQRGVKLWEIAEKLGIYDGNFSRKLRREFSEADQERVLAIIDQLAEDKKKGA